MEKIHEMMVKLVDECEKQNIPLLEGFGRDKISIYEFAPDDTPERLIKARTTLVSTVKQARRVLEIQA